jgi:hypothetical protein
MVGSLAGITAVASLFGPAILRFLPLLQTPTARTIALKVLLAIAGLVVPLGALVLFFLFRELGAAGQEVNADMLNPLRYLSGLWILAIVVVALGVIAALILNINLTAPHRLYRDSLARTFIQREEGENPVVPLVGLNPSRRAPYHLINATLNVPSSVASRLRDRKSDFFFFSKHWSGASVVGYYPTVGWKMNGGDADLASAMAISGAAASSHMGLASKPTLTALLTFLNVRLGFWIRRPGSKTWFNAPGFLCLIREMTGLLMSEKRAWLNLSDGGHIENMGIYELLRRRCKFIICLDGEADPKCTFHGHLTLVRHAQIDLGVRIESTLDDLRPDLTSKWSRTHAVMCRIHYPQSVSRAASIGLLLYIKLSTTGNEPELIRRYRTVHPDFPHQTTLDQFFDEEQFEAYRQLGVHALQGLFSPALMEGNAGPDTIHEWFKHLAANLLESRQQPGQGATRT